MMRIRLYELQVVFWIWIFRIQSKSAAQSMVVY